ncbi:hypothetical protein RclHR1_00560005 [Rhizophagus clarus]|uniref:HCP-like protein n=1 Tax=Rhizophagus clarus TaxID=94130 RepID=A0A2Z6RMU7_9GLOM|nr:hypothetical protein RclHR1_00560005 [Rhizophagus clarus]
MTLTDAANQHKMIDKHGRLLGLHINVLKLMQTLEQIQQTVIKLKQEVADDEVNEFPEAKVRYGDCLYKGKGVEQNFSEALKYFEKAAEDNIKVAMYNVGNMNYYGTGCAKNNEKAIYYMKLAAYNDYDPAIKFCKDYNF